MDSKLTAASAALANNPNYKPLTSGIDAFTMKFNCKDVSDERCRWVKEGFISAFDHIAKILVIYTPIAVDVRFHSFCNDGKEYMCGDESKFTIGSANPLTWFTGKLSKRDSQSFSYPSALVKQLQTKQSMSETYSEFDIRANFNADVDFWFKVNTNEKGEIVANSSISY